MEWTVGGVSFVRNDSRSVAPVLQNQRIVQSPQAKTYENKRCSPLDLLFRDFFVQNNTCEDAHGISDHHPRCSAEPYGYDGIELGSKRYCRKLGFVSHFRKEDDRQRREERRHLSSSLCFFTSALMPFSPRAMSFPSSVREKGSPSAVPCTSTILPVPVITRFISTSAPESST